MAHPKYAYAFLVNENVLEKAKTFVDMRCPGVRWREHHSEQAGHLPHPQLQALQHQVQGQLGPSHGQESILQFPFKGAFCRVKCIAKNRLGPEPEFWTCKNVVAESFPHGKKRNH